MWQCQKTASPCTLGCPRMWAAPASFSHPASHLSAQPWSLSVCLCCSTIAPTNWGGVGCWMTWITSTCVEGGWQPECAHTLARCHTVPFSLWRFLTSSHIHTHIQSCAHADPLWWLWQPFVRSKRFLSKQNQSPPPSSAAESSGARSLPASLFKSGLKRQADLHSTFTFEKNWGKLGELWLRKCLAEYFIIRRLTEKQEMKYFTSISKRCFFPQGQVSLFSFTILNAVFFQPG